MAEQRAAAARRTSVVPTAATARSTRRQKLVKGDARLVLSEHARQDKQLLSALSRRCA